MSWSRQVPVARKVVAPSSPTAKSSATQRWVACETVTGVAECRDPACAVTVGIASVVVCGQIQNGIAPRRAVEYVLLLVGHGHLFLPVSPADDVSVTFSVPVGGA